MITEPDPEAVAAVLDALPIVVRDGSTGAGTYLPGRRIDGVRVLGVGPDAQVEVHVALVWPITVADADAAVRTALADLVTTRLSIVITDVVTKVVTTVAGAPTKTIAAP